MSTAQRAWGAPPFHWLTVRAPTLSYVVYVLLCVFDSAQRTGLGAAAVAVVVAVPYGLLLRRHLGPDAPETPPRVLAATLLAQAVLTYLPLLFGSRWVGFAGMLGAALLSTLPARWGLPLAVAVVAGQEALIPVLHEQFLATGDVLSLLLGYYLVARLTRLITELRASQGTAAELAAAQERLRMSRDLHDLLGRGLITVAVKSELAAELTRVGNARAAEEIDAVARVTRLARTELAGLAGGATLLDLDTELTAAISLLRDAGITVEADIADHEGLSTLSADVLAWAVREGATNVLRHSHARTCELTLTVRNRRCRLSLLNDGAPPAAGEAGIGLAGQAERVQARGGVISAGPQADAKYALVVEVPTR